MSEGPPDAAASGSSAHGDHRVDDPRWLADLYDGHAFHLYRYALVVLAHHADAEDVVQEVFTALARRGPRAARVVDVDRYLRRAVRNACFSRLRSRRRNGGPSPADARPRLEPVGDAAADPRERLAIERALAELPPEQREVVHLKTYEGMTFQQIAGVTGASINTVASRYRYALDRLRSLL
jgi:RNA polymerase sigma-70 factor (ECF subfamily)